MHGVVGPVHQRSRRGRARFRLPLQGAEAGPCFAAICQPASGVDGLVDDLHGGVPVARLAASSTGRRDDRDHIPIPGPARSTRVPRPVRVYLQEDR